MKQTFLCVYAQCQTYIPADENGVPAEVGEDRGLLLPLDTVTEGVVAGGEGVTEGEPPVVAGLETGVKEEEPGAGLGAAEGEVGQVFEVLPAHVWTH